MVKGAVPGSRGGVTVQGCGEKKPVPENCHCSRPLWHPPARSLRKAAEKQQPKQQPKAEASSRQKPPQPSRQQWRQPKALEATPDAAAEPDKKEGWTHLNSMFINLGRRQCGLTLDLDEALFGP